MTTIVILKHSQFVLPKEICKQAHLHKGEKVIIETRKDGSIQIRPFKENSADKRLRKMLNHPLDLGEVRVKDRQDIYDDIT